MSEFPSEPDEEPYADAPERAPKGLGVIVVLAIIPFTLVWLFVWAIIGDSIATFGPWVFYFAVFGFACWLVVKGHVATPPGWTKVAQDLFPRKNRRRQMRYVALLLFGGFVVLTLANVQLTLWLIRLREFLWNWTVPWPSGWG